jgi:hypothetical protein
MIQVIVFEWLVWEMGRRGERRLWSWEPVLDVGDTPSWPEHSAPPSPWRLPSGCKRLSALPLSAHFPLARFHFIFTAHLLTSVLISSPVTGLGRPDNKTHRPFNMGSRSNKEKSNQGFTKLSITNKTIDWLNIHFLPADSPIIYTLWLVNSSSVVTFYC